jgi:hypothetical protein
MDFYLSTMQELSTTKFPVCAALALYLIGVAFPVSPLLISEVHIRNALAVHFHAVCR